MSEDQDISTSEWPILLFNVKVTSRPDLQLRIMSGSMAPTAARVCVDQGLLMHLVPLKTLFVSQGHTAAGGSGDIQTQALSRTMLGFLVLLWLGSVLKPRSYTATKGHIEVQG